MIRLKRRVAMAARTCWAWLMTRNASQQRMLVGAALLVVLVVTQGLGTTLGILCLLAAVWLAWHGKGMAGTFQVGDWKGSQSGMLVAAGLVLFLVTGFPGAPH